jgi:hypothetical protein
MEIQTPQALPAKVEILSKLGKDSNAGSKTEKFAQLLAETIEKAGLEGESVTIQVRAGEVSVRFDDDSRTTTAGNTANPFSNPGWSAQPLATAQPLEDPFPWAATSGPRDFRDELPQGGGLLTASGAPRIEALAAPLKNQYGYVGPAATNPYYSSPSNPLRPGYVLGFEKWFTQGFVTGPAGIQQPLNGCLFCTEEGAQEALRLVRQFEPAAELTQEIWGGELVQATQPFWAVKLPGGRSLNAGGVLHSYYNGGFGVTSVSDTELVRALSV